MSARPGSRPDASFHTRNDAMIEHLRVPPQSVEAEQAVLGGLMLDPNAFDRVAETLALIGRIGTDGRPFLVGAAFRAPAPASGRLFLGINDRDTANNKGAFRATVTVK